MTTPTVHLDYPVNSLVSYHYFAKADLTSLAEGGLRIIADSGAYSAASLGTAIDRDAFASWAIAQRHNLCWVASLDVIGDTEGTWRNYRYMRHQRGLDVVPTVHYGADPAALDRYAHEGVDFLGLGGMVPHKGQPDKLLRWCVTMFRYARTNHPGMRFHGWGVTHPRLVDNLPWWSVDSSGAGAAYRYGRATIYNPATGKNATFSMDARSAHAHGDLLRKHYGLNPGDVSASSRENRALHVRLGARSMQLKEAWLRNRFKVTPPTYGDSAPTTQGPNIHHVDTDPGHVQCLSSEHVGAARPSLTTHTHLGPNIHFVDAAPQHLQHLIAPPQRAKHPPRIRQPVRAASDRP